MKKIIITAAAGLTFMFGLLSFSSMAVANDGVTPANEGVCDSVQGASPGLYGLCVAYCEAQDLDSIDRPPSEKILSNYRKKMQAGDPDMPCVQASCPCWTTAELDSITSDGVAAACVKGTGTVQLINNSTATHYASGDTNRNRCAYVDTSISPAKILGLRVTPEEAAACVAEVTQACDSVGL